MTPTPGKEDIIVTLLDEKEKKTIEETVRKVIVTMGPLTNSERITVFCTLIPALERLCGLDFTGALAMHKIVEANQHGKSPTREEILGNPNIPEEGKKFLLNMIKDGR